jgi:succinate dehydrogenase / fumarate reductase cytochrome b subunit
VSFVILPTSTVGRKIAMAASGQFMAFYVLAHVLGNSTIYTGSINAYAEGLRHWPYLVVLWSSRLLLFLSILLHGYYGVLITLENRRAKPDASVVTSRLSSTFAGRTMIWTGVVTGLFLLYHLLHFTFQVTDPALSAIRHPDLLGRPDVFMMVVRSFQHADIAAVYVLGVLALGLHLLHGIQSSVQTWGLNNDRSLPVVEKAGRAAAIVLFLGYAAIPVVIVMGMLR